MPKRISEKVAKLWKLLYNQQNACKMAMSKDISGELRDVCGKGYMIASLCMKEVLVIYNQMRSPMDDSELPQRNTKQRTFTLTEDCTIEATIQYMHDNQMKLNKKYDRILADFHQREVYRTTLSDHLFVMRRLVDQIPKSISRRKLSKPV